MPTTLSHFELMTLQLQLKKINTLYIYLIEQASNSLKETDLASAEWLNHHLWSTCTAWPQQELETCIEDFQVNHDNSQDNKIISTLQISFWLWPLLITGPFDPNTAPESVENMGHCLYKIDKIFNSENIKPRLTIQNRYYGPYLSNLTRIKLLDYFIKNANLILQFSEALPESMPLDYPQLISFSKTKIMDEIENLELLVKNNFYEEYIFYVIDNLFEINHLRKLFKVSFKENPLHWLTLPFVLTSQLIENIIIGALKLIMFKYPKLIENNLGSYLLNLMHTSAHYIGLGLSGLIGLVLLKPFIPASLIKIFNERFTKIIELGTIMFITNSSITSTASVGSKVGDKNELSASYHHRNLLFNYPNQPISHNNHQSNPDTIDRRRPSR